METQDIIASPVSPERLASEIEVKFLVDPQQFPVDLMRALVDGKNHPSIAEKGRITQLYLPVTAAMCQYALSTIIDLPLEPLSEADIAHFSNPDNVTEIRILQREQSFVSDKKRSSKDEPPSKGGSPTVDPDAFQITMKGKANEEGSSRPNIETPITTNRIVCEAVVRMLESLQTNSMEWHDHVKKIEKMWYDIKIPNPEDPNNPLNVELDIFPDISYLAVAEVEFPDEESLNRLKDKLPAWFYKDITKDPAFKVRNLAGKKELSEIESKEIASEIQDIRSRLAVVYQPTALGDALGTIDPATIKDKSFVMLGSFKRWLPQFRRISQDLARRSKGVYPQISTLDIARRQIATNQSDAAFRIEAEETMDLVKAEKGYLKKIREADAVYLVAPEGRIGKSSGQEAAYAVSKNKALYISNVVDIVASDMHDSLKLLLLPMIKDLMSGEEKDHVQRRDISQLVMNYLVRTIKGDDRRYDESYLKRLMYENVVELLEASAREDANQRRIKEEKEKG